LRFDSVGFPTANGNLVLQMGGNRAALSRPLVGRHTAWTEQH